MASTETDDFENGWTLVDKDGQIDIEVRVLRVFNADTVLVLKSSSRSNEYHLEDFVLSS